jgi:hypothetical protein
MSNLLPLLVEQFHKKTTKTDKHMVVILFSDKAHMFIMYFYGGFSRLRINLPTKLCRCFRQALFVSHKALSFPTNVFRFRQALVVSDNRFVGKLRVPKLDKTRDGMPHLRPRHLLQYDQKIGLQAHKRGQFTLHHQPTVIQRTFVLS